MQHELIPELRAKMGLEFTYDLLRTVLKMQQQSADSVATEIYRRAGLLPADY